MSRSQARQFLFSAVLLLAFPGVALADLVQGRVAASSAGFLALTVFDTQNRPYPNTLKLKMDNRTKLSSGYSSSSLPRVKDMVRVDVSREKSGQWRANSVSKLQGKNLPAPVAAPSPSLTDALNSPTGRNVVRGAATGAMTGAVASYASGGKAGKGALVGAGVGAAAGLLQGMFSQPSQGQQQQSSPDVRYDGSNSSN